MNKLVILLLIGIYIAIAICTNVAFNIATNDHDLFNVLSSLLWPITWLVLIVIGIFQFIYNVFSKYIDEIEMWFRRRLVIHKIKKKCEFDSEDGKLVDTEENWKIARDIFHEYYWIKYKSCDDVCPLANWYCHGYQNPFNKKLNSMGAIVSWFEQNA